LQLVGEQFGEEKIINAAIAYEESSKP